MDERVSQLVPEPFHARGNMFSLHGRVALVTGSSQGLGFEIARGFADAGIRARRPLVDLSERDILTLINTNLLAAIEMSRLATELMREHSYGRIINITSVLGRLVRRGDFIYPISKQALETATKVIAVEMGRDGILCNAIAPGTFATEFNQELISKPENIERMRSRNPLQR